MSLEHAQRIVTTYIATAQTTLSQEILDRTSPSGPSFQTNVTDLLLHLDVML